MTRHIGFFALLALSACAPNTRFYKSMADLTPEQRLRFANVDAYYLGKAKEQAAFTLNCAPQQLAVTVVSTKPSRRDIEDLDKWWIRVEQGAEITTIGAEGCSQRASYQVLCGPNQYYTYPSSWNRQPCDVIPSNDAGRVVNQNNQEQQRLNDEAARRAAEEQPQKK